MNFSKLSSNEKLAVYGAILVIVGAILGFGGIGGGGVRLLPGLGMLGVIFLPPRRPAPRRRGPRGAGAPPGPPGPRGPRGGGGRGPPPRAAGGGRRGRSGGATRRTSRWRERWAPLPTSTPATTRPSSGRRAPS